LIGIGNDESKRINNDDKDENDSIEKKVINIMKINVIIRIMTMMIVIMMMIEKLNVLM
jgi:hypothetical protein